jgi:molybdopterin-guanine dinucleotide biosynthesis protein A
VRRANNLRCGIFIGGQSQRMGGRPKGLLREPATGQTLVGRLLAQAQGLELDCVLVGQRPEYAGLGLPMLADDPPGIGPMGGLAALLSDAPRGAVALSCDLPYLSRALLGRLLSVEVSGCDVVAPRRNDRFEPLCALYLPSVLPALRRAISAGEHSLQRLLAGLHVKVLPLDEAEARELDDWDSPDDLPR